MEFEDILYEVRNGVAWITINRPDKMNSFRGQTCDEIIKALNRPAMTASVGAIVLAGAGDRAFCTGGDQSAHDGNYDGRGTIGLPMEELHDRHPRRAQAGHCPRAGLRHRRRQRAVHDLRPDDLPPRRRSSARWARRWARSIRAMAPPSWRASSARRRRARSGTCAAATAAPRPWRWAWPTPCVPHEQLDAEVQKWAEEICERSPTALAIAKRSFNCRHRAPGGIAGHGHVRAEALLRHRGIARGRQCAEGKAQARLPQVREVAARPSTPACAAQSYCTGASHWRHA